MGEAPEGRGGIQRDEPWMPWRLPPLEQKEAGEAGYRAGDSSGMVADS